MCKSDNSTCEQCGKIFRVKNAGKANKYCSIGCYRDFQKSGKYKARHSKRKHHCSNCGEVIVNRSPSHGSENIFCNRDCYNSHYRNAVKECEGCGSQFRPSSRLSKYCCNDCRLLAEKPEPVKCISCGVVFSAIQIRRGAEKWYVRMSKRKTCSAECLSMFHKSDKARKEKISIAFRASNHPNWQGGSHYAGTRGPGWERIAERCRELHNRTCKHCGMTENDSKARGWGRLQVNHIVPFHQWQNKEAANRQSNLEALCKSCHSKADWKWRKENPVQMTLNIFK